MKTAYLFKTTPQLTDVTVDNPQGIYFTTVTSDLRFLNEVAIAGPDFGIRFFIKQKVVIDESFVGIPTMWVMLLSEKSSFNNDDFEHVWETVNNYCSRMYPYLKMGIPLDPSKSWVYPNISDNWEPTRMKIDFNESGNVAGIYWDNPDAEEYEENGEIKKIYDIKTIKADFITFLGSENMISQSHITHLTIPSKNIVANKKEFHLDTNIIQQMENIGFDFLNNDVEQYLLRLFTLGISSKEFISGYLVFYQIIEVLEKLSMPTKLKEEAVERLLDFISKDADLKIYKERFKGMVGGLKNENSFTLIEQGLTHLLGEDSKAELSYTKKQFKEWRHTRGDLSHADKQVEITDLKFIERYKSLKEFCTQLINTILKNKGFDFPEYN